MNEGSTYVFANYVSASTYLLHPDEYLPRACGATGGATTRRRRDPDVSSLITMLGECRPGATGACVTDMCEDMCDGCVTVCDGCVTVCDRVLQRSAPRCSAAAAAAPAASSRSISARSRTQTRRGTRRGARGARDTPTCDGGVRRACRRPPPPVAPAAFDPRQRQRRLTD